MSRLNVHLGAMAAHRGLAGADAVPAWAEDPWIGGASLVPQGSSWTSRVPALPARNSAEGVQVQAWTTCPVWPGRTIRRTRPIPMVHLWFGMRDGDGGESIAS